MVHSLELPAADPGDASFDRGSMYFVGTATTILRYAGFTILTDPNFLHAGDHVHLGYGLTSERRTDPALEIDELPADIDFVLLSHYHGDHFDRVVEEELDASLPIVTTEHAAEKVATKGFENTYPLDTWEEVDVHKGDATLTITAMPGRHGPPVVEKALPPVMGSMLEFHRGDRRLLQFYVTGDTVLFDALEEIPERYPDIDVAVLHLGGTKILGVLLTMDAGQGVEAVELFDADDNVPIHYDDYEVYSSDLEDFQEAVEAAGLDDRVSFVRRGETYEFAAPGPE